MLLNEGQREEGLTEIMGGTLLCKLESMTQIGGPHSAQLQSAWKQMGI